MPPGTRVLAVVTMKTPFGRCEGDEWRVAISGQHIGQGALIVGIEVNNHPPLVQRDAQPQGIAEFFGKSRAAAQAGAVITPIHRDLIVTSDSNRKSRKAALGISRLPNTKNVFS